MPGNPWDNSNIIMGNRSGDYYASAITGVASAFGRGIQDYFAKQEKRKKEDQTVEWIEGSGMADKLFPQLAAVKDPGERRKIMSAGIKGAGLDNMVQVQQFVQQQERQKREDEVQNEFRRSQSAANNALAAQRTAAAAHQQYEQGARGAALSPIEEDQQAYGARGGYLTRDPAVAKTRTRTPTPSEMVARYGSAGGTDEKFIKAVGALPQGPGGLSFTEDPITGERFAISPKGSVAKSGVNPTKVPGGKTGLRQYDIGGQSYFVGPGNRYFDGKGQPVVFKTKADELNPIEQAELSSLPAEIADLQKEITSATKQDRSGNKKSGPDWMPIGDTFKEKAATLADEVKAKQRRLQELLKRAGAKGTAAAEIDDDGGEPGEPLGRKAVGDPLSYVLGN